VFAPPPVVETRVFAELPASMRRAGETSEWIAGQPPVPGMHSLLEGPSFDRDGPLWCVDVPFGRVFNVSPDGEFTVVADYDGEPNGLKIHRDGRILVADHKHGIVELDRASGAVRTVVGRAGTERFKAVNDLFFAANGDLYFTDQGLTGMHDPTGCVYRLRADGGLDRLLDNVPSPNGIVANRDESELFVAATRANCVWRVQFLADGTPTKVGVFVQMSGGTGPDGMALDEEGNLYVAHVGLGVVWAFSPLGEPIKRIQSCRGPKVTNMAFGGPENRTLFVTEVESGCILAADLDVPGKPMFSHL